MSVPRSPGHVPKNPFCTIWSNPHQEPMDSKEQRTDDEHSPDNGTPIRGPTMKEYEEQLSQLKKENFNLKLRIYFLEERMGLMSSDSGREDLLKNAADLKEELEELRKEKEEKEELIHKAHQLVELTDKQCKSKISEKDEEVAVLKSQIMELKKELEIFKMNTQGEYKIDFLKRLDSDVNKKISNLEDTNRQLNEKIHCRELELKRRNQELSDFKIALEESTQDKNQLNTAILERDELLINLKSSVKTYENEVQSLKKKIRSYSTSPIRHSCKDSLQKVIDKYRKLNEEHQKAILYIQDLMKKNKIQEQELEMARVDIKDKEQHIHNLKLKVELPTAVSMEKCQIHSGFDDSHMENEFYGCEDNKDIVQELEAQVKGLAVALREKEQKLVDCEKDLLARDNRIEELMNEIYNGEMGYWKRQARQLENRLRNTPERDIENRTIMSLRAEVLQSREDIEKAEAWQREAVEKFAILMRRLEELAMFLKTLLTDGKLICDLSDKKRFLLTQIVEESMELSRNLNTSLFGSPETSLSSGPTSLQDTQQQSLLEFWSQDEEDTDIASQIGVELEKQDEQKPSPITAYNESSLMSMTFYNTFHNYEENEPRRRLCSQSESEAWSEPDRNVSLARIGLPDGDVKPRRSHETSESEETSLNISGNVSLTDNDIKLKMFEQENEALRDELNMVYEIVAKLKPATQDACMNTSFNSSINVSSNAEIFFGNEQSSTFPSELLMKHIKHQHDKLKASLKQNEFIWHTLEEIQAKSDSGHETSEKMQACHMLEEQIEEMKKKETELQEQVHLLKEHVAQRECEVRKLSTEMEKKETELIRSEENRQEFEKKVQLIEHDMKQYEEKNMCLEKDRESLNVKCTKYQSENEQMKSDVEKLESKLKESYEIMSKLEAKLIALEKRHLKSEENRLKLEKELKMLENKHSTTETERISLNEKLQAAEKKLKYAEYYNHVVKRRIQKMENEKRLLLEDIEKRRSELDKKIEETEKLESQLKVSLKHQVEEEKRINDVRHSLQEREKELERKQDELTVRISKLEMRNACLENEKLHVERELHRMEILTEKSLCPRSRLPSGSVTGDMNSMEYSWANLLNLNVVSNKEQESDNSLTKGIHTNNPWLKAVHHKTGPSFDSPISRSTDSPDLGIDSDHGRFSSLETVPYAGSNGKCRSCYSLKKENLCLKQQQKQTQTLLEDMLSQLSTANVAKKQMGKAIFKELCKTKHVLCTTRNKLETSSLSHQ